MELREQLVRSALGKCRHFNGTQHDCCEAGMNYRQLAGTEIGWGLRLPCGLTLPAGKEPVEQVTCDKRAIYSREEAEQRADAHMKRMDDLRWALSACADDAKAHGFKKGRGGYGEVACPVCTTGRLQYSVAGYNGHMHGRCSTPTCMSWMQ